jgi:phenylalanyl-tRNA synthetase alpha chain
VDLADLIRDLEALRSEALHAIAAAPDAATLEALELDILGKKGRLTSVLRGIGALPADDRPKVGAIANTVRQAVEAALAERGTALRGSELEARLRAEAVDVTTPGRPIRRGTLHPSIEAMREIASIFEQFGFVVYESPEIEDDVTNFQMLNIPPDHPARDLWDTLYIDVEGVSSAPIRHRVRSGSCRPRNRRSGPCSLADASGTRRSMPATARSSSRSRA